MMTTRQRKRFVLLQRREQEGVVNEAEQIELDRFVQQIEAEEAAYLRPATQRVMQQRLETEAQNAAIRDLIERQESLARRLEQDLAFAKQEREAIRAELQQILGKTPPTVGANR